MTTLLSRRQPRHGLPANLFAIPFGVAGLAQCWTVTARLGATPWWPADVLWCVTAGLWLLVTIVWSARLRRPADLLDELAHPTFGPFVPLVSIVVMLLGGAFARTAPTAGQVIFVVGLVPTLLAGGWLTGGWILADSTLSAWHPGYFLPTVAGGLVAAAVAAGLGDLAAARVLFGYGVVSWIVLGSIILTRLFTQPALPRPLRPSLAIQLAPPVVAGVAWFQIDGVRPGPIAYTLAGYGLLMALVQLRLVPFYRGVTFGPGWWAFSFSYAATVAYCIEWLAAESVPGLHAWALVSLAVATAGVGALAVRTLRALALGRFLPPLPAPRTSTP